MISTIKNKLNNKFVVSDLIKNYSDFNLKVSFEIEKGEFLSILGPSGSGKSTILKLLAGFEKIDSGTISVFGKDITRVDASKRNMGIVFQDYTLFPHLNVFDNIAYGLKVKKENKTVIKNKVGQMLELLNMNGYEGRSPQTLSGGEQQRVAIARALIIDPDLFLLDEPFSSLDANLRKSIRREISQIQKKLNITTIFITHNQEEALSISDKILLIKDGEVIQFGTPEELYESPVNNFAAFFLGDVNTIDGNTIRPENLTLLLPDDAQKESLSHLDKSRLLIQGKINDVEYYGSFYNVYVDTPEYNTIQVRIPKQDFVYNLGQSVFITSLRS
jgi:ABC-type Fe3+/spermidine/putrescine transport system ATPase subunit